MNQIDRRAALHECKLLANRYAFAAQRASIALNTGLALRGRQFFPLNSSGDDAALRASAYRSFETISAERRSINSLYHHLRGRADSQRQKETTK